ncbi:reverse transcriptase-like protein [Thermosipho ferrireducens]|uniref:Reverse transcriptase-like protein n=1 Tax=Thermosipho ferrireducens TaxID=2571116 RepID=A0ABX7S9M7_9BACT|nr:RNase H family protein [Thermosipho ferrireducens]QTA38417.1 reverse transcriptase-like protein [Thermosipho ferrireducens]
MKLYVDGSYSDLFKVASYAFCLVDDEENILKIKKGARYLKKGNSVISEIIGTIEALKYCAKNNIKNVVIYHDYNELPMFASKYRRTKNPIINAYIKTLSKMREDTNISFKKVTAHKDDKYNNLVDKLSREHMQEYIEKNIIPKLMKNDNLVKNSNK